MREINFKEIGWKFRVSEDMWRKLCLSWQDELCGIEGRCPLCVKHTGCYGCPAYNCSENLGDYLAEMFGKKKDAYNFFLCNEVVAAMILDVLLNAKKVR